MRKAMLSVLQDFAVAIVVVVIYYS